MAKSKIYQQLAVSLPNAEYPIYIGANCLVDSELLRRHVHAQQVLIVTNETIAPLYLQQVQQALSSLQCDVVILPDGEVHKNQENLFKIFDALIKYRHHRDTTLVALGGGVIGDITGFAAATYQRGVPFIQLPTTLLAQVDASIGGKTAINHPMGKNMIGSFYQPNAVIMDLSTLSTLPEREFRSGFAEVIKYGLLQGNEFLKTIRDVLAKDLTAVAMEDLAPLIADSCRIKARYVQQDEHERGQRALLNLGHTFAHALEAYTHYQRWLHGEAVAIGIYCAALLSYQLGHLDKTHLDNIDFILEQAKLPRRIPKEIDLDALCELMQSDKKIQNKSLRFVLIKAPGQCYLDKVTDECLRQALIDAVEGEN